MAQIIIKTESAAWKHIAEGIRKRGLHGSGLCLEVETLRHDPTWLDPDMSHQVTNEMANKMMKRIKLHLFPKWVPMWLRKICPDLSTKVWIDTPHDKISRVYWATVFANQAVADEKD